MELDSAVQERPRRINGTIVHALGGLGPEAAVIAPGDQSTVG